MPTTFTDEAFHDLRCPFQRIIRKPEIVNIIRRLAIIYGQPNIFQFMHQVSDSFDSFSPILTVEIAYCMPDDRCRWNECMPDDKTIDK